MRAGLWRCAPRLSGREVVVAGGGLAGASCAWQLAERGASVTLVEPRALLGATSQYSTECYRDFFIDSALVPFMSRSVELMETLAGDDNVINLTRRGYCFFAGSDGGKEALERFAVLASDFGAGELRSHKSLEKYLRSPASGFRDPALAGIDLVYGSDNIQQIFPFVTKEAQVMLHARKCGWMDSQGLGQAMLAAASESASATRTLRGRVAAVEKRGEDVAAVRVLRNDGAEELLPCDAFVNCGGAWMSKIQRLVTDEALPLENEVHAKVILNDVKGVIPQSSTPFMVWRDQMMLDWDAETREGLVELDDTAEGGIVNSSSWVGPQPGGQHLRPAGNGRVLMLWEHLHRHMPVEEDPEMPLSCFLDMYPELCLAGLQKMVPGLGSYHGELGRDTLVDGGYYTNTPDQRPLVGSHGARNAFVCGGMGTYGLMGSPAAGELLAKHVMQEELPSYAGACSWPRLVPPPEIVVDLLDDS
ncbi:unnamed protein product [Effrenium voratum]|uniref:FAD-dependent oxidoreductase domain-containing protein 1 n=1 Tax=Effrenium voratum TaxID=2562239 RepID=A0AA36IH61_9DINO|nr:unnamed protein product [Effrenium voratum]CAJ1437965.1 unnamed protein product [Effrenium voratum]